MKYIILILISLSNIAATFTHESELGVIGISGNTSTNTESAKHKSEVSWGKNNIKFESNYFHSSSLEDNSESWLLGLRFERSINSKVSYFLGNSFLGDRSLGYDLRSYTDVGGKYNYHKTEESYLFLEAGYRLQYEENISGKINREHFLRFYSEIGKSLGIGKITSGLELLPNVLKMNGLQINFDSSLVVILTDILSLKVSYLYKFNNSPSLKDGEKLDEIYTITFLAKY